MKIYIVSNDWWGIFNKETSAGGGIEICVESLCLGLYKRNINFTLICPKRQNPIDMGFPIIETKSLPCANETPSNFLAESFTILNSEKPDIIWGQSNWSQEFSKIAPTISFIHDGYDDRPDNFTKNYPNSYLRYVSYSQMRNLCKLSWEKERSFTCYTGLPEEEFIYAPIEQKSGLLWVGSLYYGINSKGLLDFIELAKRNPVQNFLAYGVGEPSSIEYIKQITKDLANFEWRGKLNRGKEHQEAFRKAKYFCQFSHLPESAGRTVIESLSKSTAILGLQNRGATEELVGVEGGIVKKSITELEKQLYLNYNTQTVFKHSQNFHINKEIDILIKQSQSILNKGKLENS